MKVCRICEKSKQDIYFVSGGNNTRRNICKKCHKEYNAKWRKSNLKKCKLQANKRYKKFQKLKKSGKLSIEKQITFWSNQNAQRSNRPRICLKYLKKLCFKSVKKYPYIDFSATKKKGYWASIDRINPNKGYEKGNIRIIPLWLNSAKLDLSIRELNGVMNEYLRK